MKNIIKMKLLFIIALISFITSKSLIEKVHEDEEEGGIESANNQSFDEQLLNELKENNLGDVGRGVMNNKFYVIAKIVSNIATGFGVESVYPTNIVVNKDTISKVELTFSVSDMDGSYAKEIKEKFIGNIKTEKMEYQVAIK